MCDLPPSEVTITVIHIREGVAIKIQGLPFDLTTAEATKIGNVVKALANEKIKTKFR